MLPGPIREAVESALAPPGTTPDPVTDATPLGGGCVSPVARIETGAGRRFVLKWSDDAQPAGLLSAEARGLELLAATETVRVPAVMAVGETDGAEWLVSEWLEPASPTGRAWGRLGAELASLHAHRGTEYGDERDNFIGPLPQSNRPAGSWPAFWWSRRLEPQLRRAVDAGLVSGEARRRFEDLEAVLPALLGVGDDEGPSRLHGDLWNGNVHMLTDDAAALIDPSVYHGHREVDLAMAELFGGFGDAFHAAYRESWPLQPGYAPRRRAAYQLYYLLVHVNLFGAGYLSGTLRALNEAAA